MGVAGDVDVTPSNGPADTSSIEKTIDKAEGAYGEVETAGYDAAATKKLLWKCDKALLPFLALLYLLSFLDRTNIGNARLANLEADLGMEGLDYNVSPPSIAIGPRVCGRDTDQRTDASSNRLPSPSSSRSMSRLRFLPTWP
jgi:hypothetical protein